MKKLLIAGLFALFLGTYSNAQFSAQAGLNSVSASVDTGVAGLGSVSSSELGVFFGGAYDFDLSSSDEFTLQLAALFSIVSDLTSLYIPVMVQYEFAENFRAMAGPQINWLLEDVPDGALGVDLGFGAQYDITDVWYVFARYAFEIIRGGDYGELVDLNTLTFGVGYRFN